MSLALIARSLGLSVTTVSRALGGYDDVADATRALVVAEAERLDYRPNQAARRLRRGRSEAIGIVLPSAPGPVRRSVLPAHAVGDRAVAGPAPGWTCWSPPRVPARTRSAAYRHLVEGRRVDGILLARTRRQDDRIAYLLDRGMPFVAHGRAEEPRRFAFVDIDGEAACRAATERLIGFGHRRIGLVNASPAYMFAHFRQAGWQAALDAAGLATGPMLEVEPNEENGFLAARAMLAEAAPPTALLCATDRLAVGALHALADQGLRAGREVSVIGYDDLPLASYTDPPLTTIAQPIERAAARMIDMLLRQLAGADTRDMQEVWPARLVARASDGPIHAQPLRETARGDATIKFHPGGPSHEHTPPDP